MNISFLTPTLGNRPKEITRLLDSLRMQTIKNFEVVIVIQDNYQNIRNICSCYSDLNLILIDSNNKGLSVNRNLGLRFCKGDVVVLSDDDCWYPKDMVEFTTKAFANSDIDILLTQIYDKNNNKPYKLYKNNTAIIKNKFSLLSRSSIEIAFRNWISEKVFFDEAFGLGAEYVCCEEVDFLIRAYEENAKIMYQPHVSVFHVIKARVSNEAQIMAKGALYAKNFNVYIGLLVCLRDLFIKREINIVSFIKGYYKYLSTVKKQ